MPCVALGYVSLDAAGLNLIESKSFKLYLNSFNQTVFASADDVRRTLEQDLSTCAQGAVTVELLRPDQFTEQKIIDFTGECIDYQDITITDYQFSSDYLIDAVNENDDVVEETLVSHLLKSNCLITQQPDWELRCHTVSRAPKLIVKNCCGIWCHSATITSFMSSALSGFLPI